MNNENVMPLVRKAMSGKDKDFAALCEAIVKDVLYICIRITGDHHLGEDATQEVLIQLKTGVKRLREADAFYAWLHRCINGTCRRLMAKQAQAQGIPLEELGDTMAERDVEFLPSEWAESEEMRALVVSSMQQLPTRQQHALIMFYFQGMSLREIAMVNQTTEEAAGSALYRARKNLKRQVEKASGQPLVEKLPAVMVAPTLALILQNDAAGLLVEESTQRILAAVGTATASGISALTFGGARAAIASSAVAPAAAVTAVVMVTVTITTQASSPLPSASPNAADGSSPQFSHISSVPPEEGGGGLYINENGKPPVYFTSSELQPEEESLAEEEYDSLEEEKEADNEEQNPNASPPAFSATGRLVLVNASDEPLTHDALDLSGICVQAQTKDGTPAAIAYTGADGTYTLYLPDKSAAYSIHIVPTARASLGAGAGAVQLAAGGKAVPDIALQDTQPPTCGYTFYSADGNPQGMVAPHHVRLFVADATPCEATWELLDPAGTTLATGSGTNVPLTGFAGPGEYILAAEITDLSGNAEYIQIVFIIP